jgi:hypothetical protein
MAMRLTAGAATLLTLAIFTGCNDDPSLFSDGPDVGKAPEHQVINEETGGYHGVAIGAPAAVVRTARGAPGPYDRKHDPVTPLGRDVFEMHTLSTLCRVDARDFRPFGALRYQDASFLLYGNRVCTITIIEDGAATGRGVAIGDPLDEARLAYPKLRCGEQPIEVDVEDPATVPYCSGMIRRNRYLAFINDPIDTIELGISRFR